VRKKALVLVRAWDIDSMHSGLFAARLKGLRRVSRNFLPGFVFYRFLAMYNL
jgi:hypothetical protein